MNLPPFQAVTLQCQVCDVCTKSPNPPRKQELGAARVSVALYLGPIYAAVIAWAVLSEPLRLHHYLGMALVLPGIYLVNRKG